MPVEIIGKFYFHAFQLSAPGRYHVSSGRQSSMTRDFHVLCETGECLNAECSLDKLRGKMGSDI